MRSASDLFLLTRDFCRYMRGADYFRQAQPLGCYFEDDRCYYNDLRGKVDWAGPFVDGVPVYFAPVMNRHVAFPTDVFLWGLGSLDRHFLEGNDACRENVQCAADWLIGNVRPDASFDNYFQEGDAEHEYYSNNGCMTQGLALSFALRAVCYDVVAGPTRERLSALLPRILANMLAPADQGGTAFRSDDGWCLLEFCRKDHNVVLNGWIFGLFGLFDYARLQANADAAQFLRETVQTVKTVLPRYYLPNGWSYYDSNGRINSPFYQDLQIALLDAMCRLDGAAVFHDYLRITERANTRRNRLRYMVRKIKEKLTDKGGYLGERVAAEYRERMIREPLRPVSLLVRPFVGRDCFDARA